MPELQLVNFKADGRHHINNSVGQDYTLLNAFTVNKIYHELYIATITTLAYTPL